MGEELKKEDLYYGTKLCLSKDLLKNLTKEITENAPEKFRWTLKYPERIDNIIDTVMLETTVFGKWEEKSKQWTGGYKRYLKLFRPPMITIDSKLQDMLNKYNYHDAFSSEELYYLKKWYQGTDFSDEEKTAIRNWYINPTNPKDSCHSLDDVEHISGFSPADISLMKIIVYIRGFEGEAELLKLYAKQFKGEKLSEDESRIIQDDIMKRHPSTSDMARINQIKKRRGLDNFTYKNEDGTITLSIKDKDLCALIIFDSIGQASGSTSTINVMNPNLKNRPIPDTEVLAGYRRSRNLTSEEVIAVKEFKSTLNNNNSLMWQIGSEINKKSPSEFIERKCSIPSRMAWYRHVHSNLSEYAGLEYWLNLTNDSLNLVARGDASTDIYGYKNFLTTYAYVGILNPVNSDSDKDEENNWCMTIGSDIEPPINYDIDNENLSADSQQYGFRTANGVTDLTIMGTKIGLPYQPHYPSFLTANPTMDNMSISGSRWNKNKKDFSEIFIKHTFDGLRGKMKNVLVGDDKNINDGDRLMYQPTSDDKKLNKDAKTEMYLKFKINTPYHFIKSSANVNYCIAIRVSVDEFFNNNYCENCDYKGFAIENGYNKITSEK